MFPELESRIHDHSENLYMVLGLNLLFFDGERLIVSLVRFAREMDNGRLVRFERGTAPLLPADSIFDNRFYSLAVALRRRPGDPGSKVVNEGYRPSVAVDPPLH